MVLWGVAWLLINYRLDVSSKIISTPAIGLLSVGVTGYYGFFNVGHFLLADKYATIAKVVPAKLEGGTEEIPKPLSDGTYKALLSLNIVAPILGGVCTFMFYEDIVVDE